MSRDLERVAVNTTMQLKNVAFPTDGPTAGAMIKGISFRDSSLAKCYSEALRDVGIRE